MATTKAQAIAKVSAADVASIAANRERIELALTHYNGGTVTITPVVSRKAQDKIAEEYRAAGWTVELGDDQRDGAWMTLR